MAEGFQESACTTKITPELRGSPSKRAHPKDCVEALDGHTPKRIRLENEDEGTPNRSKRHVRRRLQVTRSEG